MKNKIGTLLRPWNSNGPIAYIYDDGSLHVMNKGITYEFIVTTLIRYLEGGVFVLLESTEELSL